MKTIFITVSDDRFGRKHGSTNYGGTQTSLIEPMIKRNGFGIDNLIQLNHKSISEYLLGTYSGYLKSFQTPAYKLLQQLDPGLNGRIYKVLAIYYGLMEVCNHGDFLIYNDCSHEMWWSLAPEFKPENFDINILHELCIKNNDILTPFVLWNKEYIPNHYGIHTHQNFTTNLCMDKMGLRKFEKSYQHASGMMVIRKTPQTIHFVRKWLEYNCDPECACLGDIEKPGDYSYIEKERNFKLGHRHDQSISGLLINEMNLSLVMPPNFGDLHVYNFLNFMRKEINYQFIQSNQYRNNLYDIKPGDVVINRAGIKLNLYAIEPAQSNCENEDWFIVGLHPFATHKEINNNLQKYDPGNKYNS